MNFNGISILGQRFSRIFSVSAFLSSYFFLIFDGNFCSIFIDFIRLILEKQKHSDFAAHHWIPALCKWTLCRCWNSYYRWCEMKWSQALKSTNVNHTTTEQKRGIEMVAPRMGWQFCSYLISRCAMEFKRKFLHKVLMLWAVVLQKITKINCQAQMLSPNEKSEKKIVI